MTSHSETLRRLNDVLRTTFQGGRIMMTSGVQSLGETTIATALTQLRSFNSFDADNDPHGEHDFGSFEIAGHRFFWKIDYYTPDMQHGSEDPADPELTLRVLTLMLAEEY